MRRNLCQFLLLGLSVYVVGCSTSANNRDAGANARPAVSATKRQPQSTPGAANTVRFVAQATTPPDLFSEGSYINEQVAWVTAGFDVKRTTDGGRTWQLMSPAAEDESVFGKTGYISHFLYFLTSTRGWLHAVNGTWQTDDGGSTWRQIFAESASNPQFADELHGWIATYTAGAQESYPAEKGYQKSYVTSDGGLTWKPCGAERRLNRQTPSQAFFLTPRIGWAITDRADNGRWTNNGVARTVDGGCSWQQLWTNVAEPDEKFCNIFFLNEKEGWLAGCYSSGGLLRTKDGGKTWQKAQQPTKGATAIQVYYSDSQEGWIITRAKEAGNSDGVFRTHDGGQTWQQLTERELVTGLSAGDSNNPIPGQWKAGRLFQLLSAARATNRRD